MKVSKAIAGMAQLGQGGLDLFAAPKRTGCCGGSIVAIGIFGLITVAMLTAASDMNNEYKKNCKEMFESIYCLSLKIGGAVAHFFAAGGAGGALVNTVNAFKEQILNPQQNDQPTKQ